MSLFRAIVVFFESIFHKDSPEVQQRLQKKKLESEILSAQPALYRNGHILPNFAEAVRILYVNTHPLNELFAGTIGGSDIPKQRRFEAQLEKKPRRQRETIRIASSNASVTRSKK